MSDSDDDQDLTLQDLLDILPQLVNAAVRASSEKPPLPQHGLVSIKTGVVVASSDVSAQVQLDDEPDQNPVSVQLATPADTSDRVIVFTRAGGGAYAIGNGQAQNNALNPPPTDAFWELEPATSTSIDFLRTTAALTDAGDDTIHGIYFGEFEYVTGFPHTHRAYLQITPGTNGPGRSIFAGQDIQASAWIDGSLNTMDWYFWSRPAGGGGNIEAGTFFDAIADDGSGGQPEGYFQVYSDGSGVDIEMFADTDVTATIELDAVADVADDVAYVFVGGRGAAFIRFSQSGGGTFNVAPDAQLPFTGDWSIGYDGGSGTFILKVNDGGIKTSVLTPT